MTTVPDRKNKNQPSEASRPFDPDALRLDADFEIPEEEILANVLVVDKPKRTWWFRIDPREEYSLVTLVLALKDYGDHMGEKTWIVAPQLREAIISDERYAQFAQRREIVAGVTTTGIIFLWPLRIPQDGQQLDTWNASRRAAVAVAREKWTRMQANRPAGQYRVFTAPDTLGHPQFPAVTFGELIERGFGELIDNLDHSVLRYLRGDSDEMSS